MKAQQPHMNTIQLAALATTAAPSTFQNIMVWNIDGAAKHLFIAAGNCVTIFFGLTSNIIISLYHRCIRFVVRLAERFYQLFGLTVPKRIPSPAVFERVHLAIFRNV